MTLIFLNWKQYIVTGHSCPAPGPVPFGTCIMLRVDISLSQIWRVSLGTSILHSELGDCFIFFYPSQNFISERTKAGLSVFAGRVDLVKKIHTQDQLSGENFKFVSILKHSSLVKLGVVWCNVKSYQTDALWKNINFRVDCHMSHSIRFQIIFYILQKVGWICFSVNAGGKIVIEIGFFYLCSFQINIVSFDKLYCYKQGIMHIMFKQQLITD